MIRTIQWTIVARLHFQLAELSAEALVSCRKSVVAVAHLMIKWTTQRCGLTKRFSGANFYFEI